MRFSFWRDSIRIVACWRSACKRDLSDCKSWIWWLRVPIVSFNERWIDVWTLSDFKARSYEKEKNESDLFMDYNQN